jgi:hypothetical protein
MHERTATVAITDRPTTAAATRAGAYAFGFTWTWRFRQVPGCH